MEYRILELFSGIGGMHYAFKYSRLAGDVAAAMDINTVANAVYAHNHPSTEVLNNNIQCLRPQTLEKMGVNMITMSPPCQPHTRIGHQRDIADNRSDAFQHICSILPQCQSIQYVLVENVKGFECSQARASFVGALTEAGFYYREFILSPTQFGVPNTRHRYYCLARKHTDFPFGNEKIWQEMPKEWESCQNTDVPSIEQYLEAEAALPEDVYLAEKVLKKRVWLLDIVTADARNTMCFTKAYTHYSEGTGSIYSPLNASEVQRIFAEVKELEEDPANADKNNTERLELLKRLRLRYFTPREASRLMSFPEDFTFPSATTNRQKYRLIGNSINVRVVGELIKMLCSSY